MLNLATSASTYDRDPEIEAMLAGLTFPADEPPAVTPAPSGEPYVECKRTGRVIPLRVAEERAARTRARNTPNQRKCRARKAAETKAEAGALLAGLEIEPMTIEAEVLVAEGLALMDWLETATGHFAGSVRTTEVETPGDLLRTREAFLVADREGASLSWNDYAKRFGDATGREWDRHQAKRRVILLRKMQGPGGPWAR
ncbi:hypothetical protein [Methylobacterium oxalidis]|uniref:hypothetical protein n=1 Tax=Methylobacterium oxalidis TaxID=944322 RepID=UPI003314A2F1